MQARLLLSAMLIASSVTASAAQDFQTQQQPASPARPAATPPRPKPATHKKPAATATAAPAIKARLLEKMGDWSVFIYDDVNGGRVCFAAATPTGMKPKTAKRTPVVFYVTTWQRDGVRNEVSIKLGYPMKPKSSAVVTVGGQHFSLPADDDKAYAKDASEEQKLLTAMAAGGSIIVKATSARGTATTDEYSLEGAAGAVQKAQQACP